MERIPTLGLLWFAILCAVPALGQPYSARRSADVVTLEDARSHIVVSIATSAGNAAYEMKVNGQEILRFPFATLADFKASRPTALYGIPLLAPWANRLDEQAFYANGRRYPFDMQLGNVAGATPMHGFMGRTDQWQVVEVKHDRHGAWVTSRLDAFKQPSWMKQWPFAHSIEMTYRLADGVLEVITKVTNLSVEPMPIALGFHPYFQLTDSPRDEWTITVPARTRWLLSEQKLPTGETEPTDAFFANFQGPLKDYNLDDVFGDLVRDATGRAVAAVKGRKQQIEVALGPNYKSLVVYSPNPANTGRGSQIPPGAAPPPSARQTAPPAREGGPVSSRPGSALAARNFVCLEPMAGITNALNLAQKGVYKELQYVQPGATWQETFSIKPTGF